MSTALVSADLVRWFDQIDMSQVSLVGGKNASLGEMYQALEPHGIRVPNGFAITSAAYREFIEYNRLEDRIEELLDGLDTHNVIDLRHRGAKIRQLMNDGDFSPGLRDAITDAYFDLGCRSEMPTDVAVRSSATAEDLPDASFAGQQETYLNVRGNAALLDAVRKCFASLFTDRAISYRVDKGFDHSTVALSVGVQQMVRSDSGSSGVMFSIDTETGFPDVVLINAAYGLGETVVKGTVTPDEFYVFKPTLLSGHRPILRKRLGSKEAMMVYASGGSRATRTLPVAEVDRERFCVSDDDVLQLARWACTIEEHYSQRKGDRCPMDIEWAKDGRTGELYIVQARPETVQSLVSRDEIESFRLGPNQHTHKIVSGRAIGNRIGAGRARIVNDAADLHEFEQGEVLVTDKTDPDWEPVMKKAAAIVTNRGGRTCHAAIVSRELGVPAIVGAMGATDLIMPGQPITVSCSQGETGNVYDGTLEFEVERTKVADIKRPRTQIMMNCANPEEAFAQSMIPNDGVGLARVEFIINHIQVHPMALIQFDQLEDKDKLTIARLTRGYDDKSQYFVDELAQGVAMIASAFYPKPVIVRMSDFKTNEYANLLGGSKFEPQEENPMIGFRGASRYYDERYRDAFGLECLAMKKVRQEMGLTNVKLMIPFCRTAEEGRRVLEVMAEHGLRRGEDGLEIYVMCELPSNVLEAQSFAEVFDGFSIGSNDLTQLVLGVDRDSEVIAHLFNERDSAVMKAVCMAIEAAQKCDRKIGICGQAPSDFPEFAEFLVERGIDSISLNPDAVLKTTVSVGELEERLADRQDRTQEHDEERLKDVSHDI